MAALLNDRFAHGEPSNDIAQAGVLVRQFDTLDNPARPWRPCPLKGSNSWCAKFSDRWATSIISNDARVMYFETDANRARGSSGVGGMVLSPDVQIYCAYANDGNSMDPNKVCTPLGGDGTCIPGCYSRGEWCNEVRREWLCSYPPSQLEDALDAHIRRGGENNNEIVVATSSVVANLPSAIMAFFFLKEGPAMERERVVGLHRAFLREYPRLPARLRPPLLELDLLTGGRAPFRAP